MIKEEESSICQDGRAKRHCQERRAGSCDKKVKVVMAQQIDVIKMKEDYMKRESELEKELFQRNGYKELGTKIWI